MFGFALDGERVVDQLLERQESKSPNRYEIFACAFLSLPNKFSAHSSTRIQLSHVAAGLQFRKYGDIPPIKYASSISSTVQSNSIIHGNLSSVSIFQVIPVEPADSRCRIMSSLMSATMSVSRTMDCLQSYPCVANSSSPIIVVLCTGRPQN